MRRFVVAWTLCSLVHVLYLAEGNCVDDDAAATAAVAVVKSCAEAVATNGGNCAMDGPYFSQAPAVGISQESMDAMVRACAKSCGFCTDEKSLQCEDDDAAALAAVPVIASCADAVAQNGGTCALDGKYFSLAPQVGIAESAVKAMIAACRKSCNNCPKPMTGWGVVGCRDDEAAAKAVISVITSCAQVVSDNGGNCAKDGPYFSLAPSVGLTDADVDKLILACSKSCGKCNVKFGGACKDDDAAAKAAVSIVTTCAAAVADNGGTCDLNGPTFSQAPAFGISAEAMAAMIAACPQSCGACKAECKDDLDAAKAAIPIMESCEAVAKDNGGSCALDGPLFSQAGALGYTEDQVKTMVKACAKTCGLCGGCVDDEEAAKRAVPTVTSCAELVAGNGWTCKKTGPLFSRATDVGVPEESLDVLIASCAKSCGCGESSCKNNPEKFTELIQGLFATCEDMVAANNGHCKLDGPILSGASAAGFTDEAVAAVLGACQASCFACEPDYKGPCLDKDDEALNIAPSLGAGCGALVQQNGGDCSLSGAFFSSAAKDLGLDDADKRRLTYACAKSCKVCTVSAGDGPTPAPTAAPLTLMNLITPPEDRYKMTGKYYLDKNMTCNGQPVWLRNTTEERIFYSTPDGYWAATDDVATLRTVWETGSTDCPEVAPRVRSLAQHGGERPHRITAWALPQGSGWEYSETVRFSEKGCSVETACLALNCLEPEDGYTCDECRMEYAKIVCSDDSKVPLETVMLIVMLLVVTLVIVAVIVYVKMQNTPGTPRRSRRFSHGVPASDATNPLLLLMQRYRQRFLFTCGHLGCSIARHRGAFFGTVIVCLLLFAVTGLPIAKLGTGGGADWAPEGGRLEKEYDFVGKWREESKQVHLIVIMVGPADGGNALNKHYLMELLRIQQDILKVQVPMSFPNQSTIPVSYQDFCSSIDHPLLDTIMPGAKPCVNPSVLDCFIEGAWEFQPTVIQGRSPTQEEKTVAWKNLDSAYNVAKAVAPGALERYDGRHSFQFMSHARLMEVLSEAPKNCTNWIVTQTNIRPEMFGGLEEDPTKFNSEGLPLLTSARRVVGYMSLYSAKRSMEFRVRLKGAEEREVDRAMNEWFDRAFDRFEAINSDEENYPGTRVSIFMTVSMKRMFSEIGKARIPQIVLGYALMMAYVILSQFSLDRVHNHAVVGVLGMLLVVVANLGAYGFLSLCGITFNHTMLQALPFMALGLGVDDMFLLLHYYSGVSDKTRPTVHVIGDLMRLAGVSVTLTSLCNAFAFFSGCIIPIPALRMFLVAAGIVVILNYLTMMLAFPVMLCVECDRDRAILLAREANPSLAPTKCNLPSIQDVVENYFSPMMQKLPVRIGITVVNVAFLVGMIISLSTSAPLTFGFNIVDLTPKGTYLSQGFQEVEDYILSQYANHKYILRDTVDFPNTQRQFMDMHYAIRRSEWAIQGDPDSHWMLYFFEYGSSIGTLRHINEGEAYPNITSAYVEPSQYYKTFHDWRHPDRGGLNAIKAQLTDGFGFRWGIDSFNYNNTIMLATGKYSIDKRRLKTPDDWVRHIDDYLGIMEGYMGKGNCFPDPSNEYAAMAQFDSLLGYFWVAFVVATVVILIAAVIVPVSLRGAVLIAVTSAIATIETAALLMIADLSFSSLVAVVLLMAMGITVEFSAHVIAGFETTPGTREERLHHAIMHTTVPVLEGGISSILGFSLLAMSEFPYVTKYFFWVFFVVVLVGLAHGIFFLPALIGLVGSSTPAEELGSPGVRPGSGADSKKIISVVPVSPDSQAINPLMGMHTSVESSIPAASASDIPLGINSTTDTNSIRDVNSPLSD